MIFMDSKKIRIFFISMDLQIHRNTYIYTIKFEELLKNSSTKNDISHVINNMWIKLIIIFSYVEFYRR